MNPDVKAMWVEALTDGSYEQGSCTLRFHDKFCCLGVLCDLHAKATGGVWDISEKGSNISDAYHGSSALLPLIVIEWAGLHADHGDRVSIGGNLSTLPNHNDSGVSFPLIAKAIEAQL